MSVRRTHFVASAACTLALTAIPVSGAADSALTTSVVGLACSTGTIGFSPAGKAVSRSFTNRTLTADKVSTESLAFTPRSTAFFRFAPVTGGYAMTLATVNSDGRARLVTVTDLEADDTTTLTSTRMKNHHFHPRLIANSGGRDVFTLSRAGNLKRWTTSRDSSGRVFWEEPVLVRRGMGGLRALAWDARINVGGVKTDVLWATTRAGALKQIQIPVENLGGSKVIVVKRTGFADVTALSASFCNDDEAHASLIAIEATNNKARWFTLKDQKAPKRSNLINHGRIGKNLSWRIRAVL